MHYCMQCGSRVYWGSDFDAQDVGYENDGVTSCYTCSNYEECGALYEVTILFAPNFEDKYIVSLDYQEEDY